MPVIQVVEDDYVLCRNICDLLEAEEFQVISCPDAFKGLEEAKKHLPDLIISDVMMPGMSGFEFLEELQNYDLTASIPVIFLTAKADIDSLRTGMKLGADDYLFKPFKVDELLVAISARLKKKENYEKPMREIEKKILLNVPHELRTPFMTILGYPDLIEDEQDIDEIKRLTKIIKKSGLRLLARIEKYITYQELLVGDVPNESMTSDLEIDELFIKSLLHKLSGQFESISVSIKRFEPATIIFGTSYFNLMFRELAENALKFSDSGAAIIIEGYSQGDSYIILINDSGVGMSQQEIKSIRAFNKFGSQASGAPGMGLGLAIVKEIVKKTKIEFELSGELGSGITCKLVFPMRRLDEGM